MPRVTHTEAFWRDEFDLAPADENALQEFFIQAGRPLELDEMVRALMEQRIADEVSRKPASDGPYDPADPFEVGARLTFPSLDNETGEVVAVRAGNNDRYGPFDVLQVRFNGHAALREFAANLPNLAGRQGASRAEPEPELEPDEIVRRFAPHAREVVAAALESGDIFAHLGHRWLPRLMLVGFHEGHVHLADAMIDVTGQPMTSRELLPELPMTEQASDEVKRFSLDYALARDPRFVNVGSGDEPQWFLARLG